MMLNEPAAWSALRKSIFTAGGFDIGEPRPDLFLSGHGKSKARLDVHCVGVSGAIQMHVVAFNPQSARILCLRAFCLN
jgi:hypothetical protein